MFEKGCWPENGGFDVIQFDFSGFPERVGKNIAANHKIMIWHQEHDSWYRIQHVPTWDHLKKWPKMVCKVNDAGHSLNRFPQNHEHIGVRTSQVPHANPKICNSDGDVDIAKIDGPPPRHDHVT